MATLLFDFWTWWRGIDRLKNNSFPFLVGLLLLTIPVPPGRTQEAGDEKHSYQVTVQAGQYLQVAVQQKGINLLVKLFAPDGKQIIEINVPEATAQDRNRLAARQAFKEGEELRSQGTAESLQQAIEKYKQSLPLFQSIGDKTGEALVLNNIGLIYNGLGEKQKALDYFNQSLPLRRAVGDKAGEAVTLNNIGLAYRDLGEEQKSLEYFNQSLPLFQAVDDKRGEARTLYYIGQFYRGFGRKQKALEYFNQSLSLFKAMGDKAGEASALFNIGRVCSDSGENQKALEYFNQSRLLFQATGDKAGEASTLNNIGRVYRSLGEKQKALEYFNQALPLIQAVGDKAVEATILNNIGEVYSNLGEKQKALQYLNQSLPLIQAVGNKRGKIVILYNIGQAYFDLGEKQKALQYFNQVIKDEDTYSGYEIDQASIYNKIALKFVALGRTEDARYLLLTVLAMIKDMDNKALEAMTLSNLGYVFNTLGKELNALDYYNQALPLLRAVGDKDQEASTLYNFASLERKRGNLKEALTYIKKAIEIIESLRTKVTSQELRTSYFASVQNYYQLYIDLLMQLHKQQPSQGYDVKALETSERSRARSLLELLTEANADIRQGVDPDLLQKERNLQAQLNTVEQERIKTLSGTHTEAQAKELETQLLNLQAQYQEIQTEIRAKSPRYAALTQPQPLKLAEIQQQVLDDNTILLEYSLGEERSYLWMVTKTSITSYELSKSADIEAVAKELRVLLTDSDASLDLDLMPKFAQISQMILAPVAQQLGQKRLVIVADGILQYIPFAALTKATASKEYIPLIIDHEIVNLPSASMLAISRKELQGRTNAPKTIAVLADPVFGNDDDRLQAKAPSSNTDDLALNTLTRSATETNVSFNRLKFTAQEANAIIALISDPNQRQEIMGFAADRDAATSPNLNQYRIVHFATHGIMNPTNPELSGLVMSLVDKDGKPANGFLRLNDIFNLQLSADLVVMSACQTATGKEVKGEGIVGLTRGFMYAGAARVMASLWSVNDPATSQLMTKFYQRYLQQGLPAAAALRAAQLEMFKQGEWRSPYYWSAFTLQGEWN